MERCGKLEGEEKKGESMAKIIFNKLFVLGAQIDRAPWDEEDMIYGIISLHPQGTEFFRVPLIKAGLMRGTEEERKTALLHLLFRRGEELKVEGAIEIDPTQPLVEFTSGDKPLVTGKFVPVKIKNQTRKALLGTHKVLELGQFLANI